MVGFSGIWLRADWLVGLLRLLHAAGRLGGAGTGGHWTMKTKVSVEETLMGSLALRRSKETNQTLMTVLIIDQQNRL